MMPCTLEQDMCHRAAAGPDGVDRTRFYCSPECRWLDESNPGRYTGDRNYFDRYHGKALSEVIVELNLIRADGKTLVGQPHLDGSRRWTIDDIRRCDIEITSPNITMAEAMNLPSGSWHDQGDPFGAVMRDGNGFVPILHDGIHDGAAKLDTPWVAL
jgi:hypothetical protein